MSFSETELVGKIVLNYLVPDFGKLKADLAAHTYVECRVVNSKGVDDCKIRRILFICEESVILQDVEMGWAHTRFATHRVMFNDWGNVFMRWADGERKWEWDACWEDGFEMYIPREIP